ncbi:hypothetical protein SDRG_03964 [Saprolegnia diclina VS20]|uniref:Uncharacterized protein n=1 Tax=Saprolegnia diclina (strain VS20) TaxID=1156394 RepID=T0S8Q5_SAPDV|nr:hypothetical protein SDRG_03964 [Saprolegnia diclina VS20]EQC39012.1 hypothetical protein SDRG_03964 [Saprolegnia diclina VS20]|eukprot:XP_008607836.1 hypothetical protein SDRG_03964 [Saprolegnia diclina VS20]
MTTAKRLDPRTESDAAPITGYCKDRFDPSHPDADWGGYVNRTFKKRSFKDPLSTRDHLVHGKDAILPALTAEKPAGRRTFAQNLNQASVDPAAKDSPFHTGVHQVGPGGEHNCNTWKTSYELQTSATPTNRDTQAPGTVRSLGQLAHKRHPQAAVEAKRATPPRTLPPLEPGQSKLPEVRKQGSLLAGIGQRLASSDALAHQPLPTAHLCTAYVTQQKTLETENRHKVLLGYTGHRKGV